MSQPNAVNPSRPAARNNARRAVRNLSDRLLRPQELVLAGRSPYEVIHDDGLVRLRHYHPLTEDYILLDGVKIEVQHQRHAVPLVIVPPLAVNMYIYDLFPERSMIRYLQARGYDIYLLDWARRAAAMPTTTSTPIAAN